MGYCQTQELDLHAPNTKAREIQLQKYIQDTHVILEIFPNTDSDTPLNHIWAFSWVKHLKSFFLV